MEATRAAAKGARGDHAGPPREHEHERHRGARRRPTSARKNCVWWGRVGSQSEVARTVIVTGRGSPGDRTMSDVAAALEARAATDGTDR